MSALTWVGIVVGVVLLVGFLVAAFTDWGPEVRTGYVTSSQPCVGNPRRRARPSDGLRPEGHSGGLSRTDAALGDLVEILDPLGGCSAWRISSSTLIAAIRSRG